MSIHHQDDETRVRYKASWRSLFWVLVLASLIRCVFLVATHDNLDQDPDAYRKLAGNVLETGVYGWKTDTFSVGTNASADKVRPTAFRPPLYPALLICVGVALDTVGQIESHLVSRQYEGLVKGGRIRGRLGR